MKKLNEYAILFLLICTSTVSFAQLNFTRYDSIVVLNQIGDTLDYAWTGGFNSPQFSEIDLNNDNIMDLFVFDRSINRISTFINLGIPNQASYVLAPQYVTQFPAGLHDWVLLRDYNCDGLMDVFTAGTGGVTVYKNITTSGPLQFVLARGGHATSDILYSNFQPDSPTPSMVNLYVTTIDIPVIDDIDGDGDLDIITFSILGSQVEYHKNLSQERYGDCDSLDFELANKCWGYFTEGATSNTIVLYDSCGFNINNPERIGGGNKHSGSSILSMDVDSNGTKDLILGDVSFKNMTLLINSDPTPNLTSSNITAYDTSFPSNNVNSIPVYLDLFPAGYYLDVTNDGVKDLVVAPNCFTGCENINGTWMYKNNRATNFPDFDFITKSFLQEDMIEVGLGSHPVFFDHNADGLMDLVIGNAGYSDSTSSAGITSSLFLYENIGTASTPAFQLIDSDYVLISTLNLDIAMNQPIFRIIPTFGDIDGDGDEDMILGGDNGKLHYFENIAGPGNVANFVLNEPEYRGIDIGVFAAPQLVDLNRDGLLDLIIGDRLGFINYYENMGTTTVPSFSFVTSQLGGVKTRRYNEFNGNCIPFIFDDNGSYKLISGATNGYIYMYDSIEGNLGSNFYLVDSTYLNINQGGWSAVNVADINNDGGFDLVVGNVAGGVNFYKGDSNIVISVTEIPQKLAEILIYPNPTKNTITIDFSTNNLLNASLEVIDIVGRTLLTKPINLRKETMDLNGLAQGIYFVKFSNENGHKVYRVVKE